MHFNSGGSHTGPMQAWVNGNLAIQAFNEDVPAVSLRTITAANVFGGGIGDVPHDQWYDLDHVYASVPPQG